MTFAAFGTDDLVQRYPRSARPVLRVNFISSLDGAVTVDGRSGGLGGPADKQVFAVLRMVCDAVIVAAGTIRTEQYDAMRLDSSSRAWRQAHGLPEFPLMVTVSGSLGLDPAQLVFADAPVRPIVYTHAGAPADRRSSLAPVAEIVTVGEDAVDLRAAVADLHGRGATQLLCEGGPALFGGLIEADLVDELCLTLSPVLAGGDAGRIAHGAVVPPRAMHLEHSLAGGDMLLLRYTRTR
jgi:riboflavin biosynthesis pyrimidine reductase